MTEYTVSPLATQDANAHVLERNFGQELEQLQQLFRNGTTAMKEQQLDAAAATFDQIYRRIQEGVLSTCLAMRSYTYQRCGDNTIALDASRSLMQRNERDPDGYLLAANQLLLQNSRRTAMQTLTAGIEKTTPEHPQHQDLLRLKLQLQQEIEHRNQTLLWLLPAEILDDILIHLTLDDLAILASTCRSWYKTVYAWPGTWRTLTVHDMNATGTSSFSKLLARAPRQHVRKVELLYIMEEKPLSMDMYKTIASFGWDQLHTLNMMCMDDPDDAHCVNNSSLPAPVQIVANAENTLRKLTLLDDRGEVVSYALQHCPNLRSLEYEDRIDYEDEELDVPPAPLPAGPFRLKHLVIRCRTTTFNILDLIRKCPDLESFHLYYDDESLEHQFEELFRLLYYEMPSLRSLRVVFDSTAGLQVFSNDEVTPCHVGDAGLCDLVLTNNHLDAGSEKINHLIRKSKKTLETLTLDQHNDVLDIYSTISSTGMGALRVLRCAPGLESGYALAGVIKACPVLQDVFIPSNTACDAPLAALGQLKRLTNLTLTMDYGVTAHAITRFLSSTMSLHTLHVVLTKYHDVKLRRLVQRVLECPTMHTLSLHYDAWHEKSANVTTLQGSMQRSNLRKVCFIGSYQSLGMLIPWTHLKGLREIVIEEPPYVVGRTALISDQEMKRFVTRWPAITMIHKHSVRRRVCRVDLSGKATITESLCDIKWPSCT